MESEHDDLGGDLAVDALLTRTKQRSSDLRRRRRLLTGGGTGLAAVLVVAILVITLPGTATNTTPFAAQAGLTVSAHIGSAAEYTSTSSAAAPQIGGANEKSVSAAEQEFSFSLLHRLVTAGTKTNEIVSPSSLATALAMLELGAKGQTEAQIAAVLGTGKLSSSEQALGWNALAADLAKGAVTSGIALQQANAIWSQEGLPLEQTFMGRLSQQFGAGVWQVDFNSASATAAINQWASEATHGKIPQLFQPGPLGATTSLILANAVYFKGAWANPFEPSTNPGKFTTSTGAEITAKFMDAGANGISVPWATTSAYDAVELPYKGNRFSALVVMPKNESLSKLVAGLSPTSLAGIVTSLKSSDVDVSMPSYQFSTNLNLGHTLASMGMTDAFSQNADLSGITTAMKLNVQQVIQKAFIHVDPAGTEAAAVTAIGVGSSALRLGTPKLAIDHPFLFLIRDNLTGAILFASTVSDPAA